MVHIVELVEVSPLAVSTTDGDELVAVNAGKQVHLGVPGGAERIRR